MDALRGIRAWLIAILGLLPAIVACNLVPTPRPTDAPTSSRPAPATPSPTPGPTLTGSMPPISSATWMTLRVELRPDFPAAISQIVSWPAGELALTSPATGGPIVAWLSRDGRTWVRLPPTTFGTTSSATAATAGGTLVVVGRDDQSVVHVYHSSDGVSWAASRPSAFGNNEALELAGGSHGFVAHLNDVHHDTVLYSPDGVTWSVVWLPGAGEVDVLSVAATAEGFVAVGSIRPNAFAGEVTLAVARATEDHSAAWFSADGRTWQPASVIEGVTEALGEVSVGMHGLMAIGIAGGTPGITSYWTSADGRAWVPSDSPLGTVPDGEGIGGINGTFRGDGTRIVVDGQRSAAAPIEWLTSPDGSHWTTLALIGEAPSVPWYDLEPFLVPDGIIFATPRQTWLALAQP